MAKKDKRSLRLYIIISVAVLAVVLLVGSIVVSVKKSRIADISKLKQQNRELQGKLSELEILASQMEAQSNRLRTQLNDLMTLHETDVSSGGDTERFKQMLGRRERAYDKLKEEYAMLSESYNELLQEGLESSPEPNQPRMPRFSQEQMEEFRTRMKERTYEVLNDRVAEAKTEYEVGIFQQMEEVYDNIFEIQEQIRDASDEERRELFEEMGEQWRTLGELTRDYNIYQWKSLAEEFEVSNVDEFVNRAQSINESSLPFGMGPGGGGRDRGRQRLEIQRLPQ